MIVSAPGHEHPVRNSRLLPPVAALLVVFTFAAFRPVVENGFIGYDDTGYLTKNPLVARGLSWQGVAWALTTTRQANWHPLTWLSHMLDVQLFGMDAGAHHLVSLGIHALNALLLLLLLVRLSGSLWPSTLVAALFAVHPLHVESVAWAAERKDVLSTLFTLAALTAYAGAARRNAVLRSVAVPLFFCLALAAKPMPVTLPALLLLLDWWPLGRFEPPGGPSPPDRLPPQRLLLEKTPLFLSAAASAVVTLYAQNRGDALVIIETIPLAPRLANAVLSLVRYLGKTIVPRDLAPFYPHPQIAGPAWAWGGALLVVLAVTLFSVRVRRSQPWLAVGGGWYFCSLVPVLGFVQVGSQAMADRYTYLPLTGVFISIAWGLARISAAGPVLRFLAIGGAVVLLAGSAVATRSQVRLWKDDFTLFTHTERVTRGNWVALGTLGDAYERIGNHDAALAYYERALTERPEAPNLLNNVGNTLVSLGREDEAAALFRRAILVRPASPVAHFNLGRILQARGRLAEAEEHYRETVRHNPLFLPAHTNLGFVFAATGRYREAAAAFRRALELDPAVPEGRFNLGLALAWGGDDAAAVVEYQAAIARNPADAEAAALLGESLVRIGRRADAGDAFRRALAIDPGLAIARQGLEELERPNR